MLSKLTTNVLVVASMLAIVSSSLAVTETEMQQKMAQMEAKISQLEQAQHQSWLSERQAEQVKGLIREVLADADTRASLLQDGMTAGHDGKFYLASADGKFRLNIEGQIQFRWIMDTQEDRPGVTGSDEQDEGFQIRRNKVKFNGHVTRGDRKFKYAVVLAGERDDGDVGVEDVTIQTDLYDTENMTFDIMVGKSKIPFLRQELTSSSRQLAVDRGLATEYFTLDRSEQIVVKMTYDEFVKAQLSINDGADEEFSTIGADPAEIAIALRVDGKIAGDWKQMKDFTSWSGEELAAFVGAAVFYQLGDSHNGANSSSNVANYLAYTIDASVEKEGAHAFVAFMGANIDADAAGVGDVNPMGVLVEGGYNFNDQMEPFIRWEMVDSDAGGDDEIGAITVGGNYYISGHKAKVTVDLVYVYDNGNAFAGNAFGNGSFSDGLGFSGNTPGADDSEIVALRAQFQLLW